MQLSKRLQVVRYLVCLSLPLYLAPGLAQAQEEAPPPWLSVAIAQVRSGMGPAFEDLLRQFMEARQAAGLPPGQVFQVVLGHPNEYHVVIPVESIEANETAPPPMSEAEGVLWQTRIVATVQNVRFFYAATFPEHSVTAPAGAPEPALLMLRKVVVTSGRQADYEAWMTDELMPAFRQAEPLGHTMSVGVFGDSPRNYYHAYPLAGWGDLDAPDPLLEVLGERRYEALFEPLDGVVAEHELIIARPRPDLTGM